MTRFLRLWVPSFLLVLIAASVAGQETAIRRPSESTRAFELLQQGHYLAALAALESAEHHDGLMLQELATLRSFVGDDAGALDAMDRALASESSAGPSGAATLHGFGPVTAIDAIVEQSRGRQIVILNEAHHVPRHRAFSLQLARRLHEEGFTYFAAEAFSPEVDSLARRQYPTRHTGYYSLEPVFGDLIRQTLRMGFQPIAYEMTAGIGSGDQVDRINARESEQCQNLIDRIFAKDPAARVFVHVGYSHATENIRQHADGRETAWMAARLGRALGVDPLTIDQTSQTERSRDELCSPEWIAARDRGWLTQPVVFRDQQHRFYVGGSYQDAVDMQVFHPPARLIEGRPDWLRIDGYRLPVTIPEALLAKGGRVLVQAFLASEPDDAIPIDQIVLERDRPQPVLMLPLGSYRLVVQDDSGNEISRQSYEVVAHEAPHSDHGGFPSAQGQ